MLLESPISSQPLTKRLILTFFHQSFLSRDVYDRALGRDGINGRSKLTSQRQFASVRGRSSASRVSLRVARWEGPWVHLTVTKRAETSRGESPFSFPEPVVSWSRGRETLQIKPSGSGDENGDAWLFTLNRATEQSPFPSSWFSLLFK